MELNFENLAPYQSFVFGKLRSGNRVEELVFRILDDLQTVLKLGSENWALQETGEVHKNGKLEIGGFSYLVK